jgi:hypothetical protein
MQVLGVQRLRRGLQRGGYDEGVEDVVSEALCNLERQAMGGDRDRRGGETRGPPGSGANSATE